MSEVICVGIFVADIVAKPVEKLPKKGKLLLVDQMGLHSGGCACNTANALGKIGIKTGVIGKLGKDVLGDFMLNTMKSYNLNVQGIKRDPKTHTSATMVLLSPDGERSFLHYMGANAEFSYNDIDFSLIKKYKVLLLSGFFVMPKLDGRPAAKLLKQAKLFGLTTALDTAWDATGKWFSLIEPCLQYTDIFLPSIEEAKMISRKNSPEDIAVFFLNKGVKIVGLKMGEKGSYIRTKNEKYIIPPFKTKVVDATGAGDSFVAGFLTGIIKKWHLKKTGEFANAVGACCISAIGASSGIKTLNETLNYIKKNAISH
ncbi:MAG: sugar kinase [Candidatus Firestonebacteria bacterium]